MTTQELNQVNEINNRVNESKEARGHESDSYSKEYEAARQLMMFYADNCGIDLTLEKALEIVKA